jgi:hypothetical protein
MKLGFRPVWALLGVMILLSASWQFVQVPDASARLERFPKRAPGIDSRDMALTPAEAVVFHGTSAIKRLVAVQGVPVILTIVDGTRNRHAIHDPGFCFRGAGWRVASRETLPMDHGEACLFRLQKEGEAAEALYWFTDGQRQFAGPVEFWWRTALRRLTFGHFSDAPVLVILTSTAPEPLDWPSLLQNWPDLQAL